MVEDELLFFILLSFETFDGLAGAVSEITDSVSFLTFEFSFAALKLKP